MQTDKSIIITLTSRLFADEIKLLQDKVGAILPLQHFHKDQNITSVGLSPVYSQDGPADYVKGCNYLAKCTFAILEEVEYDTLKLTRIDPGELYLIKNIYQPFFQWDPFSQLQVVPPAFSRKEATVKLESNNFEIVFPHVLPAELAHTILQKVLLYNIYHKLYLDDPMAISEDEIRLFTTTVNYLGRTYLLDIEGQDPQGALNVLDNLGLYTSILTALIPKCCLRLATLLIRNNQHELLDIFRGLVPAEVLALDQGRLNVGEDMVRMEAFITYLQTLSSVFNLGLKVNLASYSADTLTATCWLAY